MEDAKVNDIDAACSSNRSGSDGDSIALKLHPQLIQQLSSLLNSDQTLDEQVGILEKVALNRSVTPLQHCDQLDGMQIEFIEDHNDDDHKNEHEKATRQRNIEISQSPSISHQHHHRHSLVQHAMLIVPRQDAWISKGDSRALDRFVWRKSLSHDAAQSVSETSAKSHYQRNHRKSLPILFDLLENIHELNDSNFDLAEELLKNLPFFRWHQSAQIDQKLMKHIRVVKYASSTSAMEERILFSQFDQASNVYVILDGTVELTHEDPIQSYFTSVRMMSNDRDHNHNHSTHDDDVRLNNREKHIVYASQGDWFGEQPILEGVLHPYGARLGKTNNDVILLEIPSSIYLEKIVTVPLHVRHTLQLLRIPYRHALTPDHRIEYACQFICDALAERDVEQIYANRPDPHSFTLKSCIYRVYTHRHYNRYLIVCSLALLTLALVEPSSSAAAANAAPSSSLRWYDIALIVETILAVHFIFDWTVELILLRINKFVSLQTFAVIALSVDLTIAWSIPNTLRFSRSIRPFFLYFYSRQLSRIIRIAFRSLKDLTHVTVVFLCFFAIFAVIGRHLFFYNQRLIYSQDELLLVPPNRSIFPFCNDSACTQLAAQLPNFIYSSFSSWSYTWLSLFTLLTTENYPDLSIPAYLSSHSYVAYFIAFLVIGSYFFLNLLISTLFISYRNNYRNLLIQLRARERIALKASFTVLDIYGTGKLTVQTFFKVLQRLRPSVREHMVYTVHRLVDDDKDGLIQPIEYFSICDILLLTFSTRTETKIDPNSSWRQVGLKHGLRLGLVALQSTLVYICTKATVIVFDIIVLFLMGSYFQTMDIFDTFLCALLFLDVGITVYARGPNEFMGHPWHVFDCVVTTIHWVGIFCSKIFPMQTIYHSLHVLRFLGIIRIMRLVSWFSILADEAASRGKRGIDTFKKFALTKSKSFTRRKRSNAIQDSTLNVLMNGRNNHRNSSNLGRMSEIANDIIKSLQGYLRVLPLFFYMMFILLATLFYSWAIIGMEIFDGDSRNCDSVKFVEYESKARYCDLSSAYLTLFQVLITSNWHEIMYRGMNDGKSGQIVSLFYISFYVIAVLFLLNLLTASFVEIYAVSATSNSLQSVSVVSDSHVQRDDANSNTKPSSEGNTRVISLGRTLRGWERVLAQEAIGDSKQSTNILREVAPKSVLESTGLVVDDATAHSPTNAHIRRRASSAYNTES